MDLEQVKLYFELGIMAIIAISSIILLFRLLFKKIDKNNDGKIEKDEISDADMQFIKDMLKESISTIATGMLSLNGLQGKQAYNLLLNEVKKNKSIFEEIDKKGDLKDEKNSQKS